MRAMILSFGFVLLGLPTYAQTPSPMANPSNATKTDMTPANILRSTDVDRIILEKLKEVHNTGAALYNDGDHGGALRIYQGGLILAKPFLTHRAKQQAIIDDGLSQIEKASLDSKVKAFRLHEVIEQIREELKNDIKAADSPQTVAPPKPPEAAASGKLLFNGKPANAITVTFYLVGTNKPLGNAKTGVDGAFNLLSPLPPGGYIITLTGDGIPAVFNKPESTTIKAELKAGVNNLPLEAK
jgi:hypothetical protein